MDGHDHKITATSAGHKGHEVHLCHRCGWPFPKAHPSAKHRRSHKRICGTIEGYKIVQSEHHLAVSDDDHASDDEDFHTPSPNVVKKNADISSRVGERSFKSEEDVYSDANMEFSDSGTSPKLEEHFKSVVELDKSLEQKSVENDLYGSGVLKVEEASDRTENLNDVRSEEISKPGPLANSNNQPDNVIPITDTTAKMVSVGHINDSQPEHGVGGSVQGEMIPEEEADIQGKKHHSASIPFDLEVGKVFDRSISAAEYQDALCDKLVMVSEVAKYDMPTPSEFLQNLDASEGITTVVGSAEKNTSSKTFEVALVDETHQSIDAAFVGVEEISHSTENNGSVGENALPQESLVSMSSVKSNESTETVGVIEHSDVACMVSSIDKEEMPKGGLDGGQTAGNSDANEGEKSHMNGNGNLESKNLNSVDAVSALGSTDNAFECEDANAKMTKKDVDHCGENTISTVLENGNVKCEEASVEVELIPDSTIPSEKPTDYPSACAADSDAKKLRKLSEKSSSSLELRDDGFETPIQGHGADKVTEVLQSVQVSEANHEIGGDDKNSLPTSSLEHLDSPVTSELPNNIHVAKNVVEVESLDVAETVSKLKDDNEVIPSGVTVDSSISIESMFPRSTSVLLSGDAVEDASCVREDAKASEPIVPAEVIVKDQVSNVVTREISENPTPSVQEDFPTSKCLNATSPDVEQTHSSDDLSTSKPADIISGAEHTFDGKALTSVECCASSDAPTEQQPVPSPSDVQDFHGTSETVDDKTLVNVEDVANVSAKSVQTEADDKPTKQTDDASAIDMSGSLTSWSDSLEANCGSVLSDALETNSQKHNTPTEYGHPDKSDTFEPPSFMTLVQSGSEGDQVTAAAEIETVQNNQQHKSDALKAGWFPSLTNVVNESEGRKKNEEIIAKVTNWSPVKQQQHGPLKSLLNEVKSPNTKQVPPTNQKVEAETKDGNAGATSTVGSVLTSETHTTKDQDPKKHVEEWNSPARYPIENKKEKKKGRPFWVPFVCCSTARS